MGSYGEGHAFTWINNISTSVDFNYLYIREK